MAEEKKPADNGRQGRVLLIKRDDKILSLLYSGNRLLRADACRADAPGQIDLKAHAHQSQQQIHAS